jgi:hypothetical protein
MSPLQDRYPCTAILMGSVSETELPLAGFRVIEATDLNEVDRTDEEHSVRAGAQ